MAVALTQDSIIGVQLESTRGTAPTSGTYDAVPFLDGCEIDPAVKQSSVFQINDGTRVKSTIVGGSSSVRARVVTPFNYETGSQFLMRAAFHSAAWSGGVINVGANASYYFSMITKFELGATDSYVTLRGCEVAQATVDMPLNGAATITYDIIGTAATLGAALPGTAVYGTLSGKNPYSTGLTGADLTWNAIGGNVGSASFTINNQATPKYAWGGSGADHIVSKNALISGSFEKYYYNDDIAEDAAAETVRALTFVLVCSEGASEDVATFNIPSAKCTSAPIADSDGTWSQKAEFTAQYNSGITGLMRLTVA